MYFHKQNASMYKQLVQKKKECTEEATLYPSSTLGGAHPSPEGNVTKTLVLPKCLIHI